MKFQLKAPYQPTGDQPQAIEKLTAGVLAGQPHQTLLGVTGSGKTYTAANVIANTQKPTLVIAHNKTLAAQLYQEFRDFFPNNAVSYFVSYYDYYQPEAYIPTTDTYIEKEATINDEIDKLRLAATTNLLTRPDTIVVASVSCIYNLGSPVEYGKYILQLVEGEIISRESLFLRLQSLQYDRSDTEFKRGSYRIRGDVIHLWPAYEDRALKIETLENTITKIDWIDPITGSVLAKTTDADETGPRRYIIYPAKHYLMDPKSQADSFAEIETDLANRLADMKSRGKAIEAYRLEQKVRYDLEMMKEFGFTNGIENYSRYFDGREPGQPPFTLLDYFAESAKTFSDGKFLAIVDESHITLPQVRGMHHGDRSRKETLIEYGFRLPSALDNRPLTFEEFISTPAQFMFVSATPSPLEISMAMDASGEVVEQLIRPTGLVDPLIELRPIEHQIEDLVIEILQRKQSNQRVLVTTLTKKMAEALTDYLNDHHKIDQLVSRWQKNQALQLSEADPDKVRVNPESLLPLDTMTIGKVPAELQTQAQLRKPLSEKFEYPKIAYLHSDIETLERSDILDDLRRGVYDVVIGINLLREGLDLPEVTLVAILDADKEGFLRSSTSLIQTMGRAARHQDGLAILYADRLTGSMLAAIDETQRRRRIQVEHNLKHNIDPITISKPIRDRMIEKKEDEKLGPGQKRTKKKTEATGTVVNLNAHEQIDLGLIEPESLTPFDRQQLAGKLKRRMNQAANDLDFELAAMIRDVIKKLS